MHFIPVSRFLQIPYPHSIFSRNSICQRRSSSALHHRLIVPIRVPPFQPSNDRRPTEISYGRREQKQCSPKVHRTHRRRGNRSKPGRRDRITAAVFCYTNTSPTKRICAFSACAKPGSRAIHTVLMYVAIHGQSNMHVV
jgi:hypothetical protein